MEDPHIFAKQARLNRWKKITDYYLVYAAGDPTVNIKGLALLGLAIAKATVEAHRGTITLSSIQGQGTTAKAVFPLGNEG